MPEQRNVDDKELAEISGAGSGMSNVDGDTEGGTSGTLGHDNPGGPGGGGTGGPAGEGGSGGGSQDVTD